MASEFGVYMSDGFGISWRVSFRCDDKPGFVRSESPAVIDELEKTPIWSELQVYAVWSEKGEAPPAKPLPAITTLKKLVKRGESLYLVRGGKDALHDRDRPDVRFSISPSETGLALSGIIRGESLRRLGLAAIDSFADMLCRLVVRWRASGVRMTEAWASPTCHSPAFVYPRLRPPRVTKPHRQRNAIVDVLDAKIPESAKYPETAIGTRALAIAAVPDGVTRRERDGVVMFRWVNDPCDADEAVEAAAAHERWLYDLLPSRPEPGYNEAGDLRLPGSEQDAPSGLDLLTMQGGMPDLYFGHVAGNQTVPPPPSRRLPNGKELAELRLLAPSREIALSLLERARAAGYDRAVYRDETGKVCDPHPPGWWAS